MTTVSVASRGMNFRGCATGAVFVLFPAEIEMSHDNLQPNDLETSVATQTAELPAPAGTGPSRRDFLQLAGGAALMRMVLPGRGSGAWAPG